MTNKLFRQHDPQTDRITADQDAQLARIAQHPTFRAYQLGWFERRIMLSLEAPLQVELPRFKSVVFSRVDISISDQPSHISLKGGNADRDAMGLYIEANKVEGIIFTRLTHYQVIALGEGLHCIVERKPE